MNVVLMFYTFGEIEQINGENCINTKSQNINKL